MEKRQSTLDELKAMGYTYPGIELIKDDTTVKEARRILAVNEVRNGASMRQVSLKYGVNVSVVAYWCDRAGVKTKFPKVVMKSTDAQILLAVKRWKVMSVIDIGMEFGYSNSGSIRRRLRKLVSEGKLDYIVIAGGGRSKVSHLFKRYIDKRLYYITKEDLNKWVRDKIPKRLPHGLKTAISNKLHDAGIDVSFQAHIKKAVMLEPEVYQRLKEYAGNSNMTVAEYVSLTKLPVSCDIAERPFRRIRRKL